jgi:enoyl-[acyl-carrier protein] reductase I
MAVSNGLLTGKVGLVVGVANDKSIAAGCAQAFHAAGAELVLTSTERSMAWVTPVAEAVGARLLLPLDVEKEGALEKIFDQIRNTFGRLDFALHSVAFCPKADLHGRVIDCSKEGVALAMDISVHSFIRMARLAEPLMAEGGCLLTVSYYGAEKVVDHYNVMGPVKSALEGAAQDPGRRSLRCTDRPSTRPSAGAALVTIEDVGGIAMGLVSDIGRNVTGSVAYVDAGYHVMS